MTFEEMEKSLKALVAQIRHIEDAQIVQGVLERRSEDRIESLAAAAERTNSSVEKLLQVVTAHEERLVGVEDRQAEMQASMKALFETIDRFIRGLGSDGHKGTPEQS
jgi:predicted ArsR family transcriptional regulator